MIKLYSFFRSSTSFRLRIALITSDGDPEFRFRMVQAEQEQEEMADDFADLLYRIVGSVALDALVLRLVELE